MKWMWCSIFTTLLLSSTPSFAQVSKAVIREALNGEICYVDDDEEIRCVKLIPHVYEIQQKYERLVEVLQKFGPPKPDVGVDIDKWTKENFSGISHIACGGGKTISVRLDHFAKRTSLPRTGADGHPLLSPSARNEVLKACTAALDSDEQKRLKAKKVLGKRGSILSKLFGRR